jgi:hypothetical protein
MLPLGNAPPLVGVGSVCARPVRGPRGTDVAVPARPRFARFRVTDLFTLKRGNFHSIANLDPGPHLTVSRVSTDNGVVGSFEKPGKAVVWKPGTITVSTVTGDASVQPVPFISTDNVVLCVPREEYAGIRLTTRIFRAVDAQ